MLLYRAEAPRRGSVHSSSVKKSKPSSSVVKTKRHSKELTKASLDERRVKAGVQSFIKLEDVIDAIQAVCGALQPEAESASHILKVAMREYCLLKDIFFKELEDLHVLETDFTLY